MVIAPHPRLSAGQRPAEHLLQHVADLSTQRVAKGFAVEIGETSTPASFMPSMIFC